MALGSEIDSFDPEAGGLNSKETILRHPTYWFDDGSLTFRIQNHIFRVHRTLICRHSPLFASLTASLGQGFEQIKEGPESDYLTIEGKEVIKVEDVEVLLQHLYHDLPLQQDRSFDRVASILRVSSPTQLDFPRIHSIARGEFEGLFPTDPLSLKLRTHFLYDGLQIATQFAFPSIRKVILYTLVTTHHFEEDDTAPPDYNIESPPTQINHPSTHSESTIPLSHTPEQKQFDSTAGASSNVPDIEPPNSRPSLSDFDSSLCRRLLTRVIEHFTPILYTPAAASHMACTDVFADLWMSYVIQPSLEDDGVYKPLETLERIKDIDWAKEGLCAECVADKREEWTEEQANVWKLMDGWISAEAVPRKA